MENRVPTKPYRYAVYDDNHVLIGYQYHERADEPTTIGTPLNKATFLQDATCTAYNKPTTSFPDEILHKLSASALRKVNEKYPETDLKDVPVGATVEGMRVISHDYKLNGTLLWGIPIGDSKFGEITTTFVGEALDNKMQSYTADMNKIPISLFNSAQEITISTDQGNVTRKLFPLSKTELSGGINYFNSNIRRKLDRDYWTRSRYDSQNAWAVNSQGITTTEARYNVNDAVPAIWIPDGFIVYKQSETVYTTRQETSSTLVDMFDNRFFINAQIETEIYIGTGTYGTSSPNSLTFLNPPRLFNFSCGIVGSAIAVYPHFSSFMIDLDLITTLYKEVMLFNGNTSDSVYFKKSDDGKTITWYSGSVDSQRNKIDTEYYCNSFY